jgi:hypothetical protein
MEKNFERTLEALDECYEIISDMRNPQEELSNSEYCAFAGLVELCLDFYKDFKSKVS